MKLQEILFENTAEELDAAVEWFKEHGYGGENGKFGQYRSIPNWIKVKRVKANPVGTIYVWDKVNSVSLYSDPSFYKRPDADTPPKPFEPPVDINEIFKRARVNTVRYSGCILKPDALVNVKEIYLRSCKVTLPTSPLDRVEKIVLGPGAVIEGGMLKVFKWPEFRYYSSYDGDERDIIKAAHIINEHLRKEERDIAECMDELIQAGLKEFAK